MKRLLLAPLLLTLLEVSCSNEKKYNSLREANDACKEWVKEGGTFELKNPKLVIDKEYLKLNPYRNKEIGYVYEEETYTMPLRWCKEERETNQVLGLRIPEIKKGDKRVYKERSFYLYRYELGLGQKNNSKVEANFYY